MDSIAIGPALGEKMRQLSTVINQMLSVIPSDKTDFIADLNRNLDSVMYSAPELMWMRWRNVADTLADHISPDVEMWTTWQKEVVEIWMGK